MYHPINLHSTIKLTITVVLSERIASMVKMCEIRSEIYGASDHVPITMEIDSKMLED